MREDRVGKLFIMVFHQRRPPDESDVLCASAWCAASCLTAMRPFSIRTCRASRRLVNHWLGAGRYR
jgi:hypothetical protein